jgi:hypothetical protein
MSTKLGWSANNVEQWTLYLREVCVEAVEHRHALRKIGGPGIEVQIDEAKFGKRKYNRGKQIKGTWVLGGVEVHAPADANTNRRKAGRRFAVAVPERSGATLLPLIREHVAPGSFIATDEWGGYVGVSQMRDANDEVLYTHGTVNHSKTFKDPRTGVNTNCIEGTWRWGRASIPFRKYHDADKVNSYLQQYIWSAENQGDLWQQFLAELSIARYND